MFIRRSFRAARLRSVCILRGLSCDRRVFLRRIIGLNSYTMAASCAVCLFVGSYAPSASSLTDKGARHLPFDHDHDVDGWRSPGLCLHRLTHSCTMLGVRITCLLALDSSHHSTLCGRRRPGLLSRAHHDWSTLPYVHRLCVALRVATGRWNSYSIHPSYARQRWLRDRKYREHRTPACSEFLGVTPIRARKYVVEMRS
jgi:hypothetical protein